MPETPLWGGELWSRELCWVFLHRRKEKEKGQALHWWHAEGMSTVPATSGSGEWGKGKDSGFLLLGIPTKKPTEIQYTGINLVSSVDSTLAQLMQVFNHEYKF